MKIRENKDREVTGSTLFTSLGLLCVLAVALGALLSGVQQDSKVNERTIVWRATLPVAEAGVEEALAYLNTAFTLQTNGWGFDSETSVYRKKRELPEGRYDVGIVTNDPPTIRSRGFLPAPVDDDFISRMVEVKTKVRRSAGIEVKEWIDCGGQGVLDSFNSNDPRYSTGGRYDPTKARDNCVLATLSGTKGMIDVGDRKVFGRVSTGTGGTVKVGSNGEVGSTTWINQNNTSGIEPGRSDDLFFEKFPSVIAPFQSGLKPSSGKIAGISYVYIFGTGDYSLTQLRLSASEQVLIAGDARVYVSGDINLTSNSRIIIGAGASLKLYCAGKNATFGGQGIVNWSGRAENLRIYALPGVDELRFAGSAEMTGVIEAPDSHVRLTGNAVFVGHIKAKSADVSGNSVFHADEALGRPTYVVAGWKELP